MLEHINLLKNALIEEFYQLYQQYNQDHIYAYTLVFNDYLLIDYLAISTQRSIFAEHEDHAQYLTQSDRWNVSKWRYKSSSAQNIALNHFKDIPSDYFKVQHSFDNPLLNTTSHQSSNNYQILLDAFKQAKDAFVNSYQLNPNQTLFFMSMPTQPEIEIHSAQYLNPEHELLQSFLTDRQPQQNAIQQTNRFKLSQADKDMLIDLAQLAEVEPYNELQVSHAAFLLTLEPHFIDTNIYIQKLIQTIASMPTGQKESCALQKDELLNRINQFYHLSQFTTETTR